jgi:hypothetical protein
MSLYVAKMLMKWRLDFRQDLEKRRRKSALSGPQTFI